MKIKAAILLSTLILTILTTLTPQVFGPPVSYPSPGQIAAGAGGSLWNAWDPKEEAVPYFINLANSYGGSYESIGKSSGNNGWDIILFKFGNPNGGVVMVDSYLHGNEFYGYHVLKSVITWLVTSNDADATRILQNNYVLVVPVASYRWGRTNYNIPDWMTTNDPANDGDECGVNLNRNFGPSWSSGLSQTNGDSYSGVSADSEAESQALIYAWNKYQPRIYWNLHQGSSPSTMCTARTSQAQDDANTARNLLSSIQDRLGVSNGWSFSVGSSYGSGYSKDGAASRGSAGFLTEVMDGWDATASKKADLESGTTHRQVKALFIAMCQAVEGASPRSGPATASTRTLSSTGAMRSQPVTADISVNVNLQQEIAVNNLSLGFQLDGYDIRRFRDRTELQNLARDANFKLVRFFHHRLGEPCSSWNEATQTGTFNWGQIDPLIAAIFAIGAEPLICFGYYSPSNGRVTVPSGMATDNDGLPRPESWANYCVYWLRHLKEKGYPVRFFEIINEPYQLYFWKDPIKLANYVDFWNVVANAMLNENPNILISSDATTAEHVLDYWITNGNDLGFLGYHKYDSSSRDPVDDVELFRRAESQILTDYSTTTYSISEAREVWSTNRGATLPVICGEANINWQYSPTTDPRIQTMVGATWTALTIRSNIMWGLDYFLYWNLAGKASTGEDFGMINGDTNEPYYVYYVEKMIGSNLGVGDDIVDSSSSSEDVRALAWKHNGKMNLLLICKVDEARTISISGAAGTLTYFKVDSSSPAMQSGSLHAVQETITLDGYSVILLQGSV